MAAKYRSSAAVLTILAPSLAGAQDLCVTNGTIGREAGGLYKIESESSRAVVNGSEGTSAELRFRYLGPSDETRALASGEIRRQIGLKLRAQDACNLIYAIWRLEPDNAIVVSVKVNPSKSRSAECHTGGYKTVAPDEIADLPRMVPGNWRVLRAETRGSELVVTVDRRTVWRGTVPAAARGLEGPAGLRSDNARLEFSMSATPGARVSGDRCEEGYSD